MYDTRAPFAPRRGGLADGSFSTFAYAPPPPSSRVEVCATKHGPCVTVESSSRSGWLMFAGGLVAGILGTVAMVAAVNADTPKE